MTDVRRRLTAAVLSFGGLAFLSVLAAPLIGTTPISVRRVFDGSIPFADNVDAQIRGGGGGRGEEREGGRGGAGAGVVRERGVGAGNGGKHAPTAGCAAGIRRRQPRQGLARCPAGRAPSRVPQETTRVDYGAEMLMGATALGTSSSRAARRGEPARPRATGTIALERRSRHALGRRKQRVVIASALAQQAEICCSTSRRRRSISATSSTSPRCSHASIASAS